METSDVRRRVVEVIERAKRAAGDRRTRSDEAAREYDVFLERVAVPIFRQVANVLTAQGYPFAVFTPAGSVRLMSDRGTQDFVEVSLDATGAEPIVLGHTSRARGRRVIEEQRPLGLGPVRDLTEEDVLSFLLKELEPFVAR
jgi:hypothetical protein